MLTIEAKKRDIKQNPNSLRNKGLIPAVVYGPKEASTAISLEQKAFDKALKEAGESTVITLVGDAGEHDVLIHDLQLNPLTGRPVHVDFYAIEKGKKVRVHVPVEFEGVSPAVKEQGGILVKVMHELEIEAMPKDLPHMLIADISKIVNFESHVTAGDVKLPSGVTLITPPEEIVALATLPKEEKEETGPIDLSAIEVEKKGKEPKEGEDAGAEAKGE